MIVSAVLVLLLSILTLVSYANRVYTEIGKFLSREFEKNTEFFEKQVEPRLGMRRERTKLSISVLQNLTTSRRRGTDYLVELSRRPGHIARDR